MTAETLPTVEEALEEIRRKPLVDLWPTVAVALDVSRGTVYDAAARGEIEVIGIGRLTPVRGLRPVRASRSLAEKAPNPRSSTRSPRRNASTISSNIALTTFSMSRS